MNLLKIKKYLTVIIISSSLFFLPSLSATADSRKIIRFYKLNKQDQQNRLLMHESRLKKTGCHNFATSPKVYRLTQIGFEYCYLYTKKNCQSGSEITGVWKEKKQDKKFTQGGAWFFNQSNPRGEKAKSWFCQ